MSFRLQTLFLLGVLSTVCFSSGTPSVELQKFQGKWHFQDHSGHTDGIAILMEIDQENVKLLVTFGNSSTSQTGRIQLLPGSPNGIDFSGLGEKVVSHGIYAFNSTGDELRICSNDHGRNRVRPVSFLACEPGGGATLSVWTRD